MAIIDRTDTAEQLSALSDFYVAQANWLIRRGRDDLIDSIADEYERDMRAVRLADRRPDQAA
jgi:hypothetical protein